MADRHGGSRLQKQWTSILAATHTITADSTVAIAGTALGISATVLRMIGEYQITPTSAPTAGDNVVITLGIGVISSDAFAVGGASLPDPAGSPDFPWMYWASHSWFSPTTSSTAAGVNFRVPFDIRSMRKLKPVEMLVFVVQYADTAGTPGMTVRIGQTRVLFGS